MLHTTKILEYDHNYLRYDEGNRVVSSGVNSYIAAIAAKPGCKSLIDLSGTSASSPKSMSGKSATSNEIAISFTITSGQALYMTGTNLSTSSSTPGVFYSSTACTDGNITYLTEFTASRNYGSTTLQKFTISPTGSYIFYYTYTGSSNEAAYIQ